MIGARLSSTQRSCRSRNDGGRRSRCPFRSRALARSISSLMSRCVAAGTRSSSSCPSPRRSPRRTTSSSSIGSGPTGRPASTVGRTSVARRTASRGPGRLAAAIEYYCQSPSALRHEAPPQIETPLLYLHGEGDGCIGVDVVRAATQSFPPGARIDARPCGALPSPRAPGRSARSDPRVPALIRARRDRVASVECPADEDRRAGSPGELPRASRRCSRELGADGVEVRKPEQLDGTRRPRRSRAASPPRSAASSGSVSASSTRSARYSEAPVLGTCAGMILLAREAVDGVPEQPLLGAIDISVQPQRLRAPGRELRGRPRAPGRRPSRCAECSSGRPASQTPGRTWRCSRSSTASRCSCARVGSSSPPFHPELTDDTRVSTSASWSSFSRLRGGRCPGIRKWSSIKHKKGAADAKRGKLFAELAREVIVAASKGGPRPGREPRPPEAIEKAREVLPAEGQHRTGDRPGLRRPCCAAAFDDDHRTRATARAGWR